VYIYRGHTDTYTYTEDLMKYESYSVHVYIYVYRVGSHLRRTQRTHGAPNRAGDQEGQIHRQS